MCIRIQPSFSSSNNVIEMLKSNASSIGSSDQSNIPLKTQTNCSSNASSSLGRLMQNATMHPTPPSSNNINNSPAEDVASFDEGNDSGNLGEKHPRKRSASKSSSSPDKRSPVAKRAKQSAKNTQQKRNADKRGDGCVNEETSDKVKAACWNEVMAEDSPPIPVRTSSLHGSREEASSRLKGNDSDNIATGSPSSRILGNVPTLCQQGQSNPNQIMNELLLPTVNNTNETSALLRQLQNGLAAPPQQQSRREQDVNALIMQVLRENARHQTENVSIRSPPLTPRTTDADELLRFLQNPSAPLQQHALSNRTTNQTRIGPLNNNGIGLASADTTADNILSQLLIQNIRHQRNRPNQNASDLLNQAISEVLERRRLTNTLEMARNALHSDHSMQLMGLIASSGSRSTPRSDGNPGLLQQFCRPAAATTSFSGINSPAINPILRSSHVPVGLLSSLNSVVPDSLLRRLMEQQRQNASIITSLTQRNSVSSSASQPSVNLLIQQLLMQQNHSAAERQSLAGTQESSLSTAANNQTSNELQPNPSNRPSD